MGIVGLLVCLFLLIFVAIPLVTYWDAKIQYDMRQERRFVEDINDRVYHNRR